jgi:hypothetical protein
MGEFFSYIVVENKTQLVNSFTHPLVGEDTVEREDTGSEDLFFIVEAMNN